MEKYIEKIMTNHEKKRILSRISRAILLSFVALLLLMISIVFYMTFFVQIFTTNGHPNPNILIVFMLTCFPAFLILIVFDKRDLLSKHELNDRISISLFLIISILRKSRIKKFHILRFRFILKFLIRYLDQIQDNLKNQFLYPVNKSDLQLLIDLTNIFTDKLKQLQLINNQLTLNFLNSLLSHCSFVLKDYITTAIVEDLVELRKNNENELRRYMQQINDITFDTEENQNKFKIIGSTKKLINNTSFKVIAIIVIFGTLIFSVIIFKELVLISTILSIVVSFMAIIPMVFLNNKVN